VQISQLLPMGQAETDLQEMEVDRQEMDQVETDLQEMDQDLLIPEKESSASHGDSASTSLALRHHLSLLLLAIVAKTKKTLMQSTQLFRTT